MQILVIEDDAALAAHMAGGLRAAGHVVETCGDGRQGLARATCEEYDVIVLDRMLPGLDGMRVLAALRAAEVATPVLIVSALGDVDARVTGLQAGGDDYMTKPVAMAEVLARVEVLARRGGTSSPASGVGETGGGEAVLRVGSLAIDLASHIVTRGERRIALTLRELRIAAYLARNAGRVVTRSMLLEAVWDYHFDPQTNIIDQHISKLRQKLSQGAEPQLIHTVRGVGYVLRDE